MNWRINIGGDVPQLDEALDDRHDIVGCGGNVNMIFDRDYRLKTLISYYLIVLFMFAILKLNSVFSVNNLLTNEVARLMHQQE
ncbi:hypothetical protein [Vibrio spartinae]|uniref:Uncharacterized protein n=1 Tax=Vibrio spartinae TaxID=1918945 RepID=A0ABX6QYP5_9VIBR|nr:hypothetical protein [Vibrio spartinae]QMV14126.1 hypothetical protein Vspart_01377 [Vibrio spartinae]